MYPSCDSRPLCSSSGQSGGLGVHSCDCGGETGERREEEKRERGREGEREKEEGGGKKVREEEGEMRNERIGGGGEG